MSSTRTEQQTPVAHPLVSLFVTFLETGEPPDGLFADDVFCDFTLPQWRLQAEGIAEVVALRKQGHPGPGSIPRWRSDSYPGGFVIEFEERWHQDGHDLYARELARADVSDDGITALSVYCTGDWDEARRETHAQAVQLVRP